MSAVTSASPHGGSDLPALSVRRRITSRLLVVDDHPAVRHSLRRLLEEEPDFEVLGVLASAEEALALARRRPIDVAVVDYQLGAGHNGLWLSRKLKRLERPPKVLVYSAYCDGLLAAAAVVAEADGILGKGGPGSQLPYAIRSVMRRPLALPIAPRELEETVRERLSDEEQIVFGMLLNGIALGQIATVLDYSLASLEARLSAMLRKLEDVPHPLADSQQERAASSHRGANARHRARELRGRVPVTS